MSLHNHTEKSALARRQIGAGYSPRQRLRRLQLPTAKPVALRTSLRGWLYARVKDHPGSSLLALAFTLGGLLMLAHFQHIEYLPVLDVRSVTGLLLGVAFTGLLGLASFAILLAVPGVVLHLCVRYKVINPGMADLDKNTGAKSNRNKAKGNARGLFVLYLYASTAIALGLHLGLPSLGITETIGEISINIFFFGVGVTYLAAVFFNVVFSAKAKTPQLLPRIRYRKIFATWHGGWLLGFLTLLQLVVTTIMFLVAPLFRLEAGLFNIINFGVMISFSGAFGIAIRHNWKTASVSIGALLLLALLLFGGFTQIAQSAVQILKLGNIRNASLIVSSSGCEMLANAAGCGKCSGTSQKQSRTFRIEGIDVLSRVGSEHLLAIKRGNSETRLLIPATDVLAITYPVSPIKTSRKTPTPAENCPRITPLNANSETTIE